MRRTDREVREPERLLEILNDCEVLRLGLMGEDGLPYIVPVHFGFRREGEQVTLYFHSAREGRKNELLFARPRVCFETDRLLRILPGGTPCAWSAAYESIIGWGTVTPVEAAEKEAAMDAILAHCGFKGKPAYTSDALKHTALWKLQVERMTGKQNLSDSTESGRQAT